MKDERYILMEQHINRALAESVRRQIMTDARLSGLCINVTASGGYVQISGIVDNEEQKKLALDLASGVPGVRHVEDRLEIRKYA